MAKYRSKQTGLTVAMAKIDSPVVHGEFCLATRGESDDGLPHILEHLIFEGSDEYPYNQALDLLATRSLGAWTNAATYQDRTCYLLSTAGTSGFLEILPIYLDHLLFPWLREEEFLTEVHHVNGDGEDDGVVYNEIRGRPSPPTLKALYKLLYPDEPGYYVNTGGSLQNMRTSTTIEKVRDYHRKYYRPENLVLIITGNINQQQIFKTIASMEEKIVKETPSDRELFKRPWQKPLQPIGKENHIEQEFPSDDETNGEVYFAFRLSNHITEDISMLEAYKILMTYLTSSKESPLRAAFVETEDPLCYSVDYRSFKYSHPAYYLSFSKVPANRTGEVIPRLRKIIKQIIDGGPSEFDLSRLRSYIDTGMVENQKLIENNLPLTDGAIHDMMHSTQKQHFQQFVNLRLLWSSTHRDHNASFWIELLYNIFNNYDTVVVEGKPSVNLMKENYQKEKERIEEQKAELGQEGLAKKREELEAAISSKVLPGEEILTKIPFGDVGKIKFRTIATYNATHNPQNLFDFSNIRLKIQISDVRSKFVSMSIYIDVSYLTHTQKLYLPLLLGLWMDSPIKKNGTITSASDMLRRNHESLMKFGKSLDFSNLAINAECQLEKLKEGISYLSDTINYPYFTRKNLKEKIEKKLLEVETSYDAESLVEALEFQSYYDNSSCKYAAEDVVQKKFLIKLKNEVLNNADKVLKDIYQIMKTVFKPEKSFLHVAANADTFIEHYGSQLLVFNSIFNESFVSFDKTEKFPYKSEREYRNKYPDSPRHIGVGLETTKSCHLVQFILYNNTDYLMESIPATMVLLRYLADEMFFEIRGRGLAYTAKLLLSVETGRIMLKLYRSAQITAAYKEVRRIFTEHLSGIRSWDKTKVDSAKGQLIYSWTAKEETIEDLALQAVLAYFKNVDTSYNRMFIESLSRVKSESLESIAKQILTQFLEADSTRTTVVCNKEKNSQVARDFAKLGYNMKLYPSYEDTFQVCPRKQISIHPTFFWDFFFKNGVYIGDFRKNVMSYSFSALFKPRPNHKLTQTKRNKLIIRLRLKVQLEYLLKWPIFVVQKAESPKN